MFVLFQPKIIQVDASKEVQIIQKKPAPSTATSNKNAVATEIECIY